MFFKKFTIKKSKKTILISSIITVILISTAITVPLVLKSSSNKSSSDDEQVVIANKKLFIKFNQNLIDNPLPPPDGKISKSQLMALNGHRPIPKVINGAKHLFKIKTNKVTGIAQVTVTITKGKFKVKVNYKINGFETISKQQIRINTTAINSVNKSDLPIPSNTMNLPSEIDKPRKGTLATSGVTYEFTTWEANDDTGTINWVARLTKGAGNPKTINGIARGFQDINTRRRQDTDIINNVSEDDLPIPSNAMNLPSEIDKPRKGTLATSGVTYEFTTWEANDDTGTINWVARLTKGAGNPKTINGIARGFQDINTRRSSQDTDIINNVSEDDLPIPNDKTQLPTAIDKPRKSTLVASGVTYEFTTWEPNDNTGTIKLAIKLTKGYGTEKIINKIIDGFKNSRFIQEKTDSKNEIEQEFLKITRHVDQELASDQWNNLVAFKDRIIREIATLKTENEINEKKELAIRQITTLGATYKQQLIIDFQKKMTHQTNNYREQVLDNGFTIPDGITIIPSDAFYQTTFSENFKFPGSIKTIEERAFSEAIFQSNPQLPGGIILKSQSFYKAKIPVEFRLPSDANINNDAFSDIRIKAWTRWVNSENEILKTKKPESGSILKELDKSRIKFVLPEEFAYQTLPNSFVIPDSVTEILDAAFFASTLPTNFRLPNRLKYLRNGAFQQAKLANGFTLQNCTKLQEIELYVFADTTLPDGFQLPSSIKTIDEYAFYGTKINSGFRLPSSVTIEPVAFQDAWLPNGFTIPQEAKISKESFKDAKLPLWSLWHNSNNNKPNQWFANKWISKKWEVFRRQKLYQNAVVKKRPSDFRYIVEFEFAERNDLPNDFQIPGGVTEIKEAAFKKTKLPSGFSLPKSLKIIGKNAFNRTKIGTSFRLNSGMTIYDEAFRGARLPNGFKIPAGTKINGNPFRNTKLPIWSRWNVPNTKIWFSNYRLEHQLKPKNNEEIKKENLPITGIEVKKLTPDIITFVDVGEFQGRELSDSFQLPQTVKIIFWFAFKNAILPNDFQVPEGVEIKRTAFLNAKLKNGDPFNPKSGS